MQSAKEILEIVKQRGFNVLELSRQTGILAPRIYKWLEGKGRPKVEDAQKLVNWARKNLDKVIIEVPIIHTEETPKKEEVSHLQIINNLTESNRMLAEANLILARKINPEKPNIVKRGNHH